MKGAAKIIPADPSQPLLPYQAKWLYDDSPFKYCWKGRQTGMSWTDALDVTLRSSRANGAWDTWVSSRDAALATQYVADARFWGDTSQIAADDLGETIIDYDSDKNPITAYRIRYSNGRYLNSLSSNPDAQAGRRGNRRLDEFALHPNPRKLLGIAQPGMMWGGQMGIITTPRGSKNIATKMVEAIEHGGNPQRISLHKVSFEDALDQGLLYKIQQQLPAGDHRLDMDEAAFFDFTKSQSPDLDTFNQEYMLVPTDDETAFISYELLLGASYPAGTDWSVGDGKGRFFGGLDVGRKKDLSVFWVWEQLGDVLYTREVLVMKNMRKSQQEALFYPLMDICERTCIDYTGMGTGWGDDAQDKYGERRIENVNMTANNKEHLAYLLKGALEDMRVRIPGDQEITSDFRKVKKEITATNNIRFTADSDGDGHADRFWAAALGLQAAAGPATEYGYRAVQPHNRNKPMRDEDDYPEFDDSFGLAAGSFRDGRGIRI